MNFAKLVASTCLACQVSKVEAIGCCCLLGATIGVTHSDTIGGILVVCALVVCWDKVVNDATI